jgi:hypothetical protein
MNNVSYRDLRAFINEVYAGKAVDVRPYGYTLTFLALAQNASATQQLSITANADFVLTDVYHRAQIGAAQTTSTKTAPFVRMLVTDSGSNEQFTNSATDLENYSTNGNDSRLLPYPRWIGGRSSLTVTLTNYAPTAETYTSIDVYFEGVLVRAL